MRRGKINKEKRKKGRIAGSNKSENHKGCGKEEKSK